MTKLCAYQSWDCIAQYCAEIGEIVCKYLSVRRGLHRGKGEEWGSQSLCLASVQCANACAVVHSVTALLCLWVRVLVSCAFCSVFFDHGLVCMCARKVSQRRWCPFGWRVYHIDCTRTMAIGWPCIGLRLSPHLPCSFQTKEAKS